MKVRRIKQNLWARRFVSNGHHPFMTPVQTEAEWRALCRSKFQPKIHGLAFNDPRSQGRRRHVPHGRRALLELPLDTLHMDRKRYKAIDRERRAGDRKSVRIMRRMAILKAKYPHHFRPVGDIFAAARGAAKTAFAADDPIRMAEWNARFLKA